MIVLWIGIGGLVLSVLGAYAIIIELVATKDKEGLFPRNHIKQMRKEDGDDLGPMERLE